MTGSILDLIDIYDWQHMACFNGTWEEPAKFNKL